MKVEVKVKVEVEVEVEVKVEVEENDSSGNKEDGTFYLLLTRQTPVHWVTDV